MPTELQTPEELMKQGLAARDRAVRLLEKAKIAYEKRSNSDRGDKENASNVGKALEYLANAYDQVSEIAENDL